MGKIARATKQMRTNEVGRFSDNKNWTDFLWEWAGGATMFETNSERTRELTKYHLRLNKDSSNGTRLPGLFSYANYAEGGAMGASDRFGIGLGTFKEQYKRFMDDVKDLNISGNTLFLIWFGLNDLVTNKRDKAKMEKVAIEMRTLCEKIYWKFPKSYFIFANVPNPQGAVRYMGKEFSEKVCNFQAGAFEFGFELARQIKIFPDNRATLLDIYTPMEHVNENLTAYGLKKGAQPHGMKVQYGPYSELSDKHSFATTSDEAHPTEAVYKLLAQLWAEEVLNRFDLGLLRKRWQEGI
jgi:lysophospholipase L1-like esterase